jgi:hypothetical protein
MLSPAQYAPGLPSQNWKVRLLPSAVVPYGLSLAGLSILLAVWVGTGPILAIGLTIAAGALGLAFRARMCVARINEPGIQLGSRLYRWEELQGAGALVRRRGGRLSGLWFDFGGQRLRVSLSPLDMEAVRWLSALAAPALLKSLLARRERARKLALGELHLDARQLKDRSGQALPYERLGRIYVSLHQRSARFIVQDEPGKPFLDLPLERVPDFPAVLALLLREREGRGASIPLHTAFAAEEVPLIPPRVRFPLGALLGSTTWMLIGIVVGAFIAFMGVSEIITGLRSYSWSAIQGTISQSTYVSDTDNEGNYRRAGMVHFTYAVGGRRYEGTRVTPSRPPYNERVVPKYPVGTRVTVHYDPEAPELSLLEPGLRFGPFLALLFGLVTIVFWTLGNLHTLRDEFEPWLAARKSRAAPKQG